MRPVVVRRSALVLALLWSSVRAADLGTLGPTYGISEPHLLNFIEERLRDKERSGELQRLMREAQVRGIESVQRPGPVPGLRATQTARTFYVDPSFTLERNVVDAKDGCSSPPARKNPLEVVSLSKHLLFFDARDPRQVVSAPANCFIATRASWKPILTGGSYLDLMKPWRVAVYFDQQGTLTQRFGIRQVPALVSQEGLRLRIDEVLLP